MPNNHFKIGNLASKPTKPSHASITKMCCVGTTTIIGIFNEPSSAVLAPTVVIANLHWLRSLYAGWFSCNNIFVDFVVIKVNLFSLLLVLLIDLIPDSYCLAIGFLLLLKYLISSIFVVGARGIRNLQLGIKCDILSATSRKKGIPIFSLVLFEPGIIAIQVPEGRGSSMFSVSVNSAVRSPITEQRCFIRLGILVTIFSDIARIRSFQNGHLAIHSA